MAGVTRRTLLAAGGAVLLAGCGKDLPEVPPQPTADEALGRALEAERAMGLAVSGLQAPRDDRELVRRLAARSDARARRIEEAAGVRSEVEGSTGDPEAAVERARAALAAHVEALPSLTEPRLRRLGTDLVVETATDLAVLGAVFGLTTAETFPGSAA
jgi:hypothetical protein